MKLLRLSPDAAADLEHIVSHIEQDRPEAARRVAETILQRLDTLTAFPEIGRPGRLQGTRELVITGLPFLAVYRVTADAVEIGRILHGRQRWP